jgi:intracellular sulfur oxidation DsrE/DsrF family protein/precorrin-6B methylase 2
MSSRRLNRLGLSVGLALILSAVVVGWGQEASVNPGINDSFRNPDPTEFQGRFEVESREVYALREEIVAACGLQPGMAVADIGAGTGLFTRMFAEAVGPDGQVIAVDIAQPFLDHIQLSARQAGLQNVQTRLGTSDSTLLPPSSVDLAFICDTYHHFEFPLKTMASIHRALRPGGLVVLIDFRRVPGESSEWVLNHVRAGQEVFEAEIEEAGFQKIRQDDDLLSENYFVVFQKVGESPAEAAQTDGSTPLVHPIIARYGGVVASPNAVEQPRSGGKVVLDVTADSRPDELNKGLDRVARLLNLYGAAGLQATDIKITVVFHGEATKTILNDAAYRQRFQVERNPNLPLMDELQKAGVEVLVCRQALNYKGIAESEVAAQVQVAAAALTVNINKQQAGYAYIPIH